MAQHTTVTRQTIPFPYTALGQELIIAASCQLAVAVEQNVKFVCKLWIDGEPIGEFKTTPNNAGMGIFDISTLFNNYVKADNLSKGKHASFKNKYATDVFPIHLIDKYCLNTNSVVACTAHFYTEHSDNSGAIVQTALVLGADFTGFNGYAKNSDVLYQSDGYTVEVFGFGIDTEDFILRPSYVGNFLTNAPNTQWCTNKDYMTMAFFPKGLSYEGGYNNVVNHMTITMYDDYDGNGSSLGTDFLLRTYLNGAYDGNSSVSYSPNTNPVTEANHERMLFVGVGPRQLRVWWDTFNTELVAGKVKSYVITLQDAANTVLTNARTINILCPNLKGYEPIRLTWLNQWGAWDYFTFNQKSVKKIATKGTTYEQLRGTWNSGYYMPNGYKGGKKTFRVNATETIKMNTDYLTEEHSEWFEELINSPEIYILKEGSGARTYSMPPSSSRPSALLEDYVTPCTLKTKSFTKKTVANDKLIQYTFEVEKTRILKTQSI